MLCIKWSSFLLVHMSVFKHIDIMLISAHKPVVECVSMSWSLRVWVHGERGKKGGGRERERGKWKDWGKEKRTHCRPPTKQCSTKQELEMKAAPEEHAAKEVAPQNSNLNIVQGKEWQIAKELEVKTLTQSPITWASSSGLNSVLPAKKQGY